LVINSCSSSSYNFLFRVNYSNAIYSTLIEFLKVWYWNANWHQSKIQKILFIQILFFLSFHVWKIEIEKFFWSLCTESLNSEVLLRPRKKLDSF
jgi:hypothetical protein